MNVVNNKSVARVSRKSLLSVFGHVCNKFFLAASKNVTSSRAKESVSSELRVSLTEKQSFSYIYQALSSSSRLYHCRRRSMQGVCIINLVWWPQLSSHEQLSDRASGLAIRRPQIRLLLGVLGFSSSGPPVSGTEKMSRHFNSHRKLDWSSGQQLPHSQLSEDKL